jgi:FkbM family methyltransferase
MLTLTMHSQLIHDVGMCNGRDTEFYLKKGFNVVAVEANPVLVEQAQNYFSDYLKNGKLILYNVAISDYSGEIDFFNNDKHADWRTTSKDFALRNERFGTTNFSKRVKCDKFEHILSKITCLII